MYKSKNKRGAGGINKKSNKINWRNSIARDLRKIFNAATGGCPLVEVEKIPTNEDINFIKDLHDRLEDRYISPPTIEATDSKYYESEYAQSDGYNLDNFWDNDFAIKIINKRIAEGILPPEFVNTYTYKPDFGNGCTDKVCAAVGGRNQYSRDDEGKFYEPNDPDYADDADETDDSEETDALSDNDILKSVLKDDEISEATEVLDADDFNELFKLFQLNDDSDDSGESDEYDDSDNSDESDKYDDSDDSDESDEFHSCAESDKFYYSHESDASEEIDESDWLEFVPEQLIEQQLAENSEN